MNMLIHPPLARCDQCPWEITVGSHEEKVRKEKIHADRAHGGEVNPNRVRGLLPSWVQPQVIGAVYAGLVRQGRLTQVGWTTNTDRRGRNAGRPAAIYEWRDPS